MKTTIPKSLTYTAVYVIITKNYLLPRDHLTVERRGVDTNFWTTELPALGKAIEASLCTLQLDLTGVRFKCKRGSKLPVFMYHLFKKMYDDEGVLINPDASTIRLLRQFTLIFYKFIVPFSKEALKKADSKFKETDSLVKKSYTDEQIDRIRPTFLELLPNIADIIPADGSGAVTEGLTNREKIGHHDYVASLHGHDCLPFNPLSLRYQNVEHFEAHKSEVSIGCNLSKVEHIPKDARGPRTICIQPRSLMSYQKPLMDLLYSHIEAEGAPGNINFTNQEINQRKAQLGSLDQSYATIDLKDASDLVSWELIKSLVNFEWFNVLEATRSPGVRFKDGSTMSINKFAPMGSALCFPIEAMLFYSIARTVVDEVYVYGDDIIVPKHGFDGVCLALKEYGLIVNESKSFNTGYFRESCGGDYYAGHPIGIVRLKEFKPLSYIAFCNNIAAGFLGTEIADDLINLYESSGKSVERRPLAESGLHHSMVYYTKDHCFNGLRFKCRWNSKLQIHEIRVPKLVNLADVERLLGGKSVSDDDYYHHTLTRLALKQKAHEKEPLRLQDWYGNISEDVISEKMAYVKYGWVRL